MLWVYMRQQHSDKNVYFVIINSKMIVTHFHPSVCHSFAIMQGVSLTQKGSEWLLGMLENPGLLGTSK